MPSLLSLRLSGRRIAIRTCSLYRLILPDQELAERMFHLAVVGEVLLGAALAECDLSSVRPLGQGGSGHLFVANGDRVKLWMEAAGIWTSLAAKSPYRQAMAGLPGAGHHALRPDILLSDGERALILECKHSPNAATVAAGYVQVVAYGAELRQLFDDVTTVVVGPDGVVEHQGRTETLVGTTLVVPAGLVQRVVQEWFGRSTTVRAR